MVIELPSLWEHQETMLNDIRASLAKYRRSILCAPPGTGKTRLSKRILANFANRPQLDGESGKALFAVHRRGLVDNASHSFGESPELPHGVIMSKRKMKHDETVQVASIDTLNAWYTKSDGIIADTYDLIVFDEAHAHISKLRSFLKPHDEKRAAHGLRPTFLLGLSATPQHKDLNQVFNHIVTGPSPQWLIDNGHLSPFRYFRGTQGNSKVLVKSGDDYTDNSVAQAMEALAGDMVKDWLRLAAGRATVGFFPRRTHAFEAMEMFRAAGVNAVYLDGETPDEERLQMFADLNEGRIEYIANVGVIERGTDIPRIGCVQMCVFVGSIVRWLQMIGRGSRIHPDVPDCLVLDHGDGVQKGWFFEDTVHWSLEWGERPAKTHQAPPTLICPACGLAYRGGKCKCGYEPTKRELKAQGLEFVGGMLQEFQRKEESKDRVIPTPEAVFVQCLYASGRSGRSFVQACGMAKSQATKKGLIQYKTPARFEVGSKQYRSIPFGHSDGQRPVAQTYGFTVGDVSDFRNPYRIR